MGDLLAPDGLADRLRRVEGRLERERRARLEAEQLLEAKSLALYEANLALAAWASDLEQRVEGRTQELTVARQLALQRAETDALTGIANRAAFRQHLDQTLGDARATAEGVALLLIDIDDFNSVNDNLGHPAGDNLLIEMARRLCEMIRPGDSVARLGGDEFAVIARGVGFRQHGLQLAQRLLNGLCRPLHFDGRSIRSSCSIGIAQAAPTGTRAEALLGDADLALYAAKHGGRARVSCYESGLREAVEQRARLEAGVREAVLSDRIEPWYQPIRHCREGRFTGVEVLARWHLPDGEIRPPSEFLATVESLGLLDTMMENMLRRAFPEALLLVGRGELDCLSINVSPDQFNHGWAEQALPRLLSETGFPARALMIELTETALLQDIGQVRKMLGVLTSLGMRIALDDFGVGYSNFWLLRQLRFDLLELDRSLGFDIESDEHSRAVTECILGLASRLRMNVVVEGVETRGQSDLLLGAGCVSQQGFLHARPQRSLIDAMAGTEVAAASGQTRLEPP